MKSDDIKIDVEYCYEELGMDSKVLSENLKLFLTVNYPNHYPKLLEAKEQQNLKELKFITHAMKSGSNYMGCLEFAKQCDTIENLSVKNQIDEIDKFWDDFVKNYLLVHELVVKLYYELNPNEIKNENEGKSKELEDLKAELHSFDLNDILLNEKNSPNCSEEEHKKSIEELNDASICKIKSDLNESIKSKDKEKIKQVLTNIKSLTDRFSYVKLSEFIEKIMKLILLDSTLDNLAILSENIMKAFINMADKLKIQVEQTFTFNSSLSFRADSVTKEPIKLDVDYYLDQLGDRDSLVEKLKNFLENQYKNIIFHLNKTFHSENKIEMREAIQSTRVIVNYLPCQSIKNSLNKIEESLIDQNQFLIRTELIEKFLNDFSEFHHSCELRYKEFSIMNKEQLQRIEEENNLESLENEDEQVLLFNEFTLEKAKIDKKLIDISLRRKSDDFIKEKSKHIKLKLESEFKKDDIEKFCDGIKEFADFTNNFTGAKQILTKCEEIISILKGKKLTIKISNEKHLLHSLIRLIDEFSASLKNTLEQSSTPFQAKKQKQSPSDVLQIKQQNLEMARKLQNQTQNLVQDDVYKFFSEKSVKIDGLYKKSFEKDMATKDIKERLNKILEKKAVNDKPKIEEKKPSRPKFSSKVEVPGVLNEYPFYQEKFTCNII